MSRLEAGRFIVGTTAALVGVAGLALGCSEVLKSSDATFAQTSDTVTGDSGSGTDGAPRDLQFRTYLKAPHPQAEAQFGYILAMDEKNLFATAPFEDVETPSGIARAGGATYVFDLRDTAAPPRRLVVPNVDSEDGQIPTDIQPKGFPAGDHPWGGLRVALSGDLVVIGVPGEDSATVDDPSDNSAPESGAVYVYNRAALGEPPQYMKAPAVTPRSAFGGSIALSGSRLAIGAPAEDPAAVDSGAVYVYERQNGRFVDPPTRIKPETLHTGDSFGTSLAIEGDLLVVGAPGDSGRAVGVGGDPSDTDPALLGDGAVYVYRRSGSHWNLEAYVKPTVALRFSSFGLNLSLSNGRFVVGAPLALACPGDESRIIDRGAAYVVSQTADVWSVEQCLSPRGGLSPTAFGWGVALAGDRLVVGSPWDGSGSVQDPTDRSRPFSGAANFYERTAAGRWIDTAYVKAPSIKENDTFGFSIALVPGLTAVGAQQESGGESGPDADAADNSLHYAGAAYLFSGR